MPCQLKSHFFLFKLKFHDRFDDSKCQKKKRFQIDLHIWGPNLACQFDISNLSSKISLLFQCSKIQILMWLVNWSSKLAYWTFRFQNTLINLKCEKGCQIEASKFKSKNGLPIWNMYVIDLGFCNSPKLTI